MGNVPKTSKAPRVLGVIFIIVGAVVILIALMAILGAQSLEKESETAKNNFISTEARIIKYRHKYSDEYEADVVYTIKNEDFYTTIKSVKETDINREYTTLYYNPDDPRDVLQEWTPDDTDETYIGAVIMIAFGLSLLILGIVLIRSASNQNSTETASEKVVRPEKVYDPQYDLDDRFSDRADDIYRLNYNEQDTTSYGEWTDMSGYGSNDRF